MRPTKTRLTDPDHRTDLATLGLGTGAAAVTHLRSIGCINQQDAGLGDPIALQQRADHSGVVALRPRQTPQPIEATCLNASCSAVSIGIILRYIKRKPFYLRKALAGPLHQADLKSKFYAL